VGIPTCAISLRVVAFVDRGRIISFFEAVSDHALILNLTFVLLRTDVKERLGTNQAVTLVLIRHRRIDVVVLHGSVLTLVTTAHVFALARFLHF